MAGGEPGLQFSLCILPRLKHPVTISSNRSQNQHIKPDWEIVLVLGPAGKMHRALMAADSKGAWAGGFQLTG